MKNAGQGNPAIFSVGYSLLLSDKSNAQIAIGEIAGAPEVARIMMKHGIRPQTDVNIRKYTFKRSFAFLDQYRDTQKQIVEFIEKLHPDDQKKIDDLIKSDRAPVDVLLTVKRLNHKEK